MAFNSLGITTSKRGSMLMGLNNLSQFNGFSPGIDLIQWKGDDDVTVLVLSDASTVTGSAMYSSGYLDANGNIAASTVGVLHVTQFKIQFWSPNQDPTRGMDGSQWKASWDGLATASINLLGSGGSSSMGANSGTFTFGTPQNNGVQFIWNITDITSPPRNLKIWQLRHDNAKSQGFIFNPDWLDSVKHFDTLRSMDWMGTNGSAVVNFSDLATEADAYWGGKSVIRAHIGVPITIQARLANETGCKIHYCIPHQATDACVTSIAQAFKAATNVKICFEYSNETWNPSFAQTTYMLTQATSSGLFSGLSGTRRGTAWSGYRAAQIMNIIRGVYNDTSRWEGLLGCEPTSATTTVDTLTGANFFLTSTSSSLVVSDLFAGALYALYPNTFHISRQITGIAPDAVGTVTCNSHGFSTGWKIRPFLVTGMLEVNTHTYTITKIDANRFQLNVDTSGFTAFSDPGNRAYCQESSIFDMLDQSIANNLADPTTYPSPYSYSNAQLKLLLTTGSCSYPFLGTGLNYTSQYTTFLANRNIDLSGTGLQMRSYESSLSNTTDPLATASSGNTSLFNVLFNFTYSVEGAAVMKAVYDIYTAAGGVRPSKFLDAGVTSLFGFWSAIRWYPGDINNPTYVMTRGVNGV